MISCHIVTAIPVARYVKAITPLVEGMAEPVVLIVSKDTNAVQEFQKSMKQYTSLRTMHFESEFDITTIQEHVDQLWNRRLNTEDPQEASLDGIWLNSSRLGAGTADTTAQSLFQELKVSLEHVASYRFHMYPAFHPDVVDVGG